MIPNNKDTVRASIWCSADKATFVAALTCMYGQSFILTILCPGKFTCHMIASAGFVDALPTFWSRADRCSWREESVAGSVCGRGWSALPALMDIIFIACIPFVERRPVFYALTGTTCPKLEDVPVFFFLNVTMFAASRDTLVIIVKCAEILS